MSPSNKLRITLYNVTPDPGHIMKSLGHNELTGYLLLLLD